MYVYQSETGQWILFDGISKWFFDTEMEARIMSRKLDFAQGVVNYCMEIAQNADLGINARTVFGTGEKRFRTCFESDRSSAVISSSRRPGTCHSNTVGSTRSSP